MGRWSRSAEHTLSRTERNVRLLGGTGDVVKSELQKLFRPKFVWISNLFKKVDCETGFIARIYWWSRGEPNPGPRHC